MSTVSGTDLCAASEAATPLPTPAEAGQRLELVGAEYGAPAPAVRQEHPELDLGRVRQRLYVPPWDRHGAGASLALCQGCNAPFEGPIGRLGRLGGRLLLWWQRRDADRVRELALRVHQPGPPRVLTRLGRPLTAPSRLGRLPTLLHPADERCRGRVQRVPPRRGWTRTACRASACGSCSCSLGGGGETCGSTVCAEMTIRAAISRPCCCGAPREWRRVQLDLREVDLCGGLVESDMRLPGSLGRN